jgi:hypothetical protein
MRWIASLPALLLLAGCGASSVPVPPPKPKLPALPASASASCARPITKLGDDLGIAALKWKGAYVCEHGKRVAVIGFYDDLRSRLKK